jgi:hypothetical protein
MPRVWDATRKELPTTSERFPITLEYPGEMQAPFRDTIDLEVGFWEDDYPSGATATLTPAQARALAAALLEAAEDLEHPAP